MKKHDANLIWFAMILILVIGFLYSLFSELHSYAIIIFILIAIDMCIGPFIIDRLFKE